jgi:hypothetical protein
MSLRRKGNPENCGNRPPAKIDTEAALCYRALTRRGVTIISEKKRTYGGEVISQDLEPDRNRENQWKGGVMYEAQGKGGEEAQRRFQA